MNAPKSKPANRTKKSKGKLKPLGTWPGNQWLVGQEAVDLATPITPVNPLTFNARPQRLTLDIGRTAMVVVDMQNDFCAPGGWLDSLGADFSPNRAPIKPLTKLIPALRRAGMPIIWLNWGNRADLMNSNPTVLHAGNPSGDGVGYGDTPSGGRSPVLRKGSWGARICDDLKTARGDIHVDKYRLSGFWDNELDSILRNLDVKTLLFAGVNSDRCVLATMQDAGFLGYDCILIDDCSATTSPDYVVRAVRFQVRGMYGFIACSQSILDSIENL